MIKDIIKTVISNYAAGETFGSSDRTYAKKVYLFEPNPYELQRIINTSDFDGEASGYVYFVQEHMNGSFKIGKTKNRHQTEVAFHKYFYSKRLEGEWFALSKEDLAWIRSNKYTDEINQTITGIKVHKNEVSVQKVGDKENKRLTAKQIEFAKTLLAKLEDKYVLNVDYSVLTQKDLSRLSVYFKFKNQGALNNLISEKILKKK